MLLISSLTKQIWPVLLNFNATGSFTAENGSFYGDWIKRWCVCALLRDEILLNCVKSAVNANYAVLIECKAQSRQVIIGSGYNREKVS